MKATGVVRRIDDRKSSYSKRNKKNTKNKRR